jgi:NADP-dependent 3-hydroxy acid dehydrogenase YdfG
MPGIKDKVEVGLITGASSGIGEATARVLAQAGAKVVPGARRTDNLEEIVADITPQAGRPSAESSM